MADGGCCWQCLWQMAVVVGSVVVDCGCGSQCCGRWWLWLAVLWLMVVVNVVVDCGRQCCGRWWLWLAVLWLMVVVNVVVDCGCDRQCCG